MGGAVAVTRDMAAWRTAVLERRTSRCQLAGVGCAGPVEIHHLILRSQGGVEDVENGLVVCRGHHQTGTDSIHSRRRRIRRGELDPDQIAYLAAHGWAYWAADGFVSGRGWSWFADDEVPR